MKPTLYVHNRFY